MFNMKNISFCTNAAFVNDTTPLQKGCKGNIQKLMQILLTTEDIELQVKIFSILATYVISNNTNRDAIITSNSLYDKIQDVLSRGLPVKNARTLNFVSALLYCEEETGTSRARSLTLHAQTMLRTSGSLAVMTNLFTNTMLHQETWKALCRCLAECCRGCTENQLYCSHLVPLCVHKCIHDNMEALIILKSLINNNDYNMNLFFESNGILIFKRKEALQYDTIMQFLNTVIQHAPKDMLNLLRNTVFDHLEHYKQVCGTQTKIGQWAFVNLYHITSRTEDSKGLNAVLKIDNNTKKAINNEAFVDIGLLKPDDTTQLVQNIFREIQHFNGNNYFCNKNSLVNSDNRRKQCKKEEPSLEKFLSQKNSIFHRKQKYFKDKRLDPITNEMSFTFLQKSQEISIDLHDKSLNCSLPTENPTSRQTSCGSGNLTNANLNTRNEHNQLDKDNFQQSGLLDSMVANDDPTLLNFKPIFVSTPKHATVNVTSKNLTRSIHIKRTRQKYKGKGKHSKYFNSSLQVINSRRDSKQRSISSRLYDAINESCTTFVKTFSNIFKTKKSQDNIEDQQSSLAYNTDNQHTSCSYSFTNYMREREALISVEKSISTNNYSSNTKFCRTCNDTRSLKSKVINNNCLRETVTKLKLGINMYGCDFKKISRVMWPQEDYMTPEVLYNLYRKLIVKK